MHNKVIEFLNGILGHSIPKSKGNYAYKCPFCNHHKHKLEVHPEKGAWQCWVCETKGKTLFSLLRKLGKGKEYTSRLNELLPKENKIKNWKAINSKSKENSFINLPKEYKPLWIRNRSFEYSTCIKYLHDRGVTLNDIIKYRIGYCDKGKYSGMIVFPNFDGDGNLNYFTTRSFFRNSKEKFKNPPLSRDVIGLEFQLNWELPIILVESALDAIIVRRNASPIYGTILLNNLKIGLLERGIKEIYLALDPDAKEKITKISEYLNSVGISVKCIDIPMDGDVNSIGYHKFWELYNNPKKIDNNTVFKDKILSSLSV